MSQIRLLHTEIDVVPGRRPQQPPAEGYVGPGAATVRLTNSTTQENAYTVRVKCDNPYWQESWCTLAPLPPTYGDANLPPTGKADQVGPQGRSVKVFISAGGSRDIQINLNVPVKPDSRAGMYDLVVTVETHIPDAPGASQKKERFTEAPAVAVIRPFYKWEMDIAPEDGRRVGLIRRSAEMEAVVTNQGNDWLYVEVRLPKPKDMLLDCPSFRIAVPPPEPGDEQTQRTVPIRATSRIRKVRGEPMSMPLAAVCQRIDAPSVAPLPEGASYSAVSANIGAAVTMTDTGESRQAPAERAVTFHPPIPTTLTGFIGSVVQSGKGLVMSVIGLIVAANLAIFMYERVFHDSIRAEPISTRVAPGGNLTVAGRYLLGSRVYINGKTLAEPKPVPRENEHNPIASEMMHIIPTTEAQYVAIKVPSEFDGQQIKLSVQRAGALSYLSPLLPKWECKTSVQVGNPQVAAVPAEVIDITGPRRPGELVEITGKGLGSGGKIFLGGKPAIQSSWSNSRLTFTVPADMPIGSTIGVTAVTSDGKQLHAGSITVVPKQTASAGALGAGQPGGGGLPLGTTVVSPSAHGSSGSSHPAVGPTTHPSSGSTGGGRPAVQPPVTYVASSAYDALIHEDFDRAATLATETVNRSQNDADSHSILAYLAAKSGKLSEAKPHLDRALRAIRKEKGKSRALAMTAKALVFEKEHPNKGDDIEGGYTSAILEDPSLELPFVALTGHFAENNKLNLAVSNLQTGISQNPNSGILYYKLATCQYLLRQNDQAKANLTKAKSLSPDVASIPTFQTLLSKLGMKL